MPAIQAVLDQRRFGRFPFTGGLWDQEPELVRQIRYVHDRLSEVEPELVDQELERRRDRREG